MENDREKEEHLQELSHMLSEARMGNKPQNDTVQKDVTFLMGNCWLFELAMQTVPSCPYSP